MKLVSFLLSLSVVIVIVATRTHTVQAHNMRGGGDAGNMIVIEEGRGLDEFDGFLSSLSMSMPAMMMSMPMPTMMMSLSMPSEMLVDPAEFGMPSTAAEEATTTATTATSSTSKASKKKTGACDYRLEVLQDTITGGYDLDEWGEEAVNAKCHYQRSKGPNFGCTIGFSPPKTWSQGDMFFWEGRNADTYAALELYCECHLGIDQGCATEIPRQCMGDCEASFHGNMIMSTTGVEKWLEYCKFSAVWNGDFRLGGDFQLAEDVEECGCYFISQERSNIDSCPGVKLGAFFPSPTPTPATISPTDGSTPSITFAPTPGTPPTTIPPFTLPPFP